LIDREGIAAAMGVAPGAWSTHKLPSGRTFNEVLSYTIGWLGLQKYILASGSHPAERVVLTDKGLAALNAVPQGLAATVGTALIEAKSEPNRRDWSQLGDLVGGIMGGIQKSLSS
jgi:hypothetical protein